MIKLFSPTGAERFRANIRHMTGKKPLFIFKLCWKYLTPAVCTVSPLWDSPVCNTQEKMCSKNVVPNLLSISLKEPEYIDLYLVAFPIKADIESLFNWDCFGLSPLGHLPVFRGVLVSTLPGQRSRGPSLGHRTWFDAHILLCLSHSHLGHLCLLRHPRNTASGNTSAFPE